MEGVMLTLAVTAVGLLVLGIWLTLEPLLTDKPINGGKKKQ
jgi:hypothetical protein